jgi:predicted nucleic acid-binding protein
MKVLLDTNVLSEVRRPAPDPKVLAWLAEDLPARFAGRILPIDSGIAERWGDLMAHARRSDFPLSVMDGFFAATALDRELVLATRNSVDLAPLGVPLFNPWADESGPG